MAKIKEQTKYIFGKKRIFIKTIAIMPKQLEFIDEIRGKKSKAGKLEEIINFYKQYVNNKN